MKPTLVIKVIALISTYLPEHRESYYEKQINDVQKPQKRVFVLDKVTHLFVDENHVDCGTFGFRSVHAR